MSTQANAISGKLLIVAVIAVGLAAAGASWWFRYLATHRAAHFWGPAAVQLIRDAPHVELLLLDTARSPDASTDRIVVNDSSLPVMKRRDISAARGLTHLRNALLEDRSFNWAAQSEPNDINWSTALVFRHDAGADPLTIVFSQDFRQALHAAPDNQFPAVGDCEPIAHGLQEYFAELATDPSPER